MTNTPSAGSCQTTASSNHATTLTIARELYRRGRRGDASVSDHPFGKAGYRYYQIEQEHRYKALSNIAQ